MFFHIIMKCLHDFFIPTIIRHLQREGKNLNYHCASSRLGFQTFSQNWYISIQYEKAETFPFSFCIFYADDRQLFKQIISTFSEALYSIDNNVLYKTEWPAIDPSLLVLCWRLTHTHKNLRRPPWGLTSVQWINLVYLGLCGSKSRVHSVQVVKLKAYR